MRKLVGPVLVAVVLPALVLFLGCGDSNIKKAKTFHAEKQYAQAIHHYRLALESDPENQIARYGLIEAYAQEVLDMHPEKLTPEVVAGVMTELRPIAQPLMSDPNIKRYLSLIYQMIAKRYAEQGRDDLAAEAWAEVIQIEPTFAEAHFNRGLALLLVGRNEEALPNFEKSVALNPYFVKGYHAIGDVFIKLQRFDEAIQQYDKALELNPEDPAIHHNLGQAYLQKGDVDKAIAEFQNALELEPGYILAYRSLHEAYENKGDKKKMQEIDEKWKKQTENYLQALQDSGALPGEAAPGEGS
ncbi:MAG: tetratricopeptide repeat protein [Candidatus Abyssobacteria bacterium SURF_5]|uniref:Tetratricopeptide repeat protein n=1 Tax=Abyssobacteria bacterium (strain SURF_5) TaxID=2093360 RepID=A0A3A4NMG9_ABYX5|nr:MAG: tetratricopeptide repeat protein [Candidatus Abyssubacteria bacterium SURF_5]